MELFFDMYFKNSIKKQSYFLKNVCPWSTNFLFLIVVLLLNLYTQTHSLFNLNYYYYFYIIK